MMMVRSLPSRVSSLVRTGSRMGIKEKNLCLGFLLVVLFISASSAADQEEEDDKNDGSDYSQEEDVTTTTSPSSDEDKFITKPHFKPYTYYYVVKQENPNGGHGGQKNVWKPVFHNQQAPYRPPQPQYQAQQWYNPGVASRPISQASTEKLPEQLKLIGASTLANLLTRAELADVLRGRGPFTVFAPTDAAFEQFIGERGSEYKNILLGDKNLLQVILLQHVTSERMRSADLIDGMKVETVAGNTLSVLETKDGLTIGGSLFTPGGMNNLAENGIIHLIDSVIYPYVSDEVATTPKPITNRILGSRSDDPKLVVSTQAGRVRGLNVNEEVRAWLGVPYAEPPTDRYRFSRPRQIKAWDRDQIKDTVRNPNACPQLADEFFGNFNGSQVWNPNTDTSEDCLYLNVYTPTNITEDLPVLVWIYGGGFMTGSAALDVYNPTEIVTRGNLIFVAMQYRVGSHGFLYMGKDSSAPGNVGLLDQTLALEWVRDNIESFGGDPKLVTIMGESAGANSVALHLMSPLSCGLFKRAILQSTGATPRWGFMTREEGLRRSVKLAQEVGCDYDEDDVEATLECLRDKDSTDLTAVEYNVDDYTLNFFPFVPTVDETFLPLSPRTMMEKGLFKDVSVLIGSNGNEGYWSLMYLLPTLFPNNELKDREMQINQNDYKEAVEAIFPFYPDRVQNLIAHEYRDRFDGKDRLFKALDAMAGDSDMTCNTEEFAQKMSLRGNRVYRYYYNHQSSVDPWPTWSGAKHGDEIEFTFGHPLSKPKEYKADEIKFARDIVTFWTNFAKNGSPNPSNTLATWPEYKEPEWQYLNLTVGQTGLTGYGTLSDTCSFWNDILPAFVPPKVDFQDDDRNVDRFVCRFD